MLTILAGVTGFGKYAGITFVYADSDGNTSNLNLAVNFGDSPVTITAGIVSAIIADELAEFSNVVTPSQIQVLSWVGTV